MRTMATYKITNTHNGKFYIGSTVNVSNRFAVHKYQLKNGIHGNHLLQKDASELGVDCFYFEVISLHQSEDELIPAEQHLIDTLNPDYNIAKDASGCFGVIARDETRRKMSESRSGERNVWFGKIPPCKLLPVTEETRKKISESRLGEKNPMFGRTPNHAKLSDEQVRSIRIESEAGVSYSSLADYYSVSKGCIAAIIQGRSYRGVI